MRQRSFILVAASVATLIVLAVAAYAYDSSNDDQVADGVKIGGVHVGGKSASEAREVVRKKVGRGLSRPLVVHYARKSFTLHPAKAGLHVDADAAVDEAVSESRKGWIFGRVTRDLTSGNKDVNVPARVAYSRAAVDRFLRRVRRGLNRPARDAHVKFPEVKRVPGRDGIEVDEGVLQARVERALRDPLNRVVTPSVRITHPKVHLADLRRKFPHLIVIERDAFQLKFYRHLHLAKTYPIAVGQIGLETPAGLYDVQTKEINPSWHVPNSSWAGSLAGRVIPPGPDDPLKARWMGITDGAGIHGTDEPGSIGSAASHGCIRMYIPDVIALYDKTPLHTPVYVA